MRLKRTCTLLAAAAAVGIVALAAPGAHAGGRVLGIDVSRFQGAIDWERVGETRVRFAFAQASRGSGSDCTVVHNRCGADEFYAANYRLAREAGIRVGAYHRAFADGDSRREARRDARAEAKPFIAQVGKLRRHDLLPALDVETPFGSLNERRLRVWVRTWLRRVRRKLGERAIVYTNLSSWQATGDTTSFARAGHRLWIANFDVASPAVPAANWSGLGWSIWQYTCSGHVKGIDGRVDKDRLRVGLGRVSVR